MTIPGACGVPVATPCMKNQRTPEERMNKNMNATKKGLWPEGLEPLSSIT